MAAITASAIIAGAGLAISAGTAGASFAAAAKQRKLQQQAEKDAERAMQEAKNKLNVNYFDVLGINKEPYELQREAALTQGAQAIEAAKESDRGVAAAAGRVQMAQNQMQSGIRTDMSADMQALDKLKASEDARLAQMQAGLSLEEVRGAQQAAADAQKAAAQYNTQGIQQLGNVATQIQNMAPLFGGQSQSGNKTPTVTSDGKYGKIGPPPTTDNTMQSLIQQGNAPQINTNYNYRNPYDYNPFDYNPLLKNA